MWVCRMRSGAEPPGSWSALWVNGAVIPQEWAMGRTAKLKRKTRDLILVYEESEESRKHPKLIFLTSHIQPRLKGNSELKTGVSDPVV